MMFEEQTFRYISILVFLILNETYSNRLVSDSITLLSFINFILLADLNRTFSFDNVILYSDESKKITAEDNR